MVSANSLLEAGIYIVAYMCVFGVPAIPSVIVWFIMNPSTFIERFLVCIFALVIYPVFLYIHAILLSGVIKAN